jgi:hypothetical protein
MHKILLHTILIISLFLTTIISFNTPIQTQAFATNFQKAVNIRSRYNTDFGSSEFRQVVDRMKSDGVNTITFVIQHNVQNPNSNDVFAIANTPTDEAIVSGVNYVKSKGMKAAFSMFVECNCGSWRAVINPSDRNQFFSSYNTVVQKYARIAQTNGIDYINLGTEMFSLTSPTVNSQNTQKWKDLIANTRANYSGKLTYGGNWGEPYEEMSKVEFWNDLDFIGISAYFDLSREEVPSVATLSSAWTNIENTVLSPLSSRFNKPIVFTEIGYRSVNQAANAPGDWSRPAYFMEDGQVNAYEAMFSFFNNRSYLAGINIWDVSSDPNDGGQGNTNYTFVNKKAEATVKKWFLDNMPAVPLTLTGTIGSQGKMSAEVKSPITGLKPNQAALLKYDIQNRSTAVNNVKVLFEVLDSTGAIVYNSYLSNQSINNAETKSFEKSWTPTKAGSYKLRGGVFAENWATTYEWFDNIASLTVDAAPSSSSSVISISSNSNSQIATSSVTTSSAFAQSSSQITASSIASSIATSQVATNSTVSSPRSSIISSSSTATSSAPTINSNLSIWWPANDVNMTGNAPFYAVLNGRSLNDYKMYWQVDNGGQVEMYNDSQFGGYKFFWVNFATWTWKPKTERYKITFTAKDNGGQVLATNSVNIFANK